MATTAQKSTQLSKLDDLPIENNLVVDNGKLRLAYFDFKQDGAGAAGSTVDLVKFGPGRFRILPALSWIKSSALGTSVTIDVGYLAYTKLDGSAGAASADAIADGLDEAAAGVDFLGTGTNAKPEGILIETKDGLTVQAKGTFPDAATLTGWIAYVRD